MGKKKRNPLLDKLGLDVEEVRAAFSVKAPDKPQKKRGYLYRNDQMRMNRRMNRWQNLVFARYEAGMHPKTIAGSLGVSEETVRVRLRASGFFKQS
jgi:DNA-binding NarL/FixJ family response regulator